MMMREATDQARGLFDDLDDDLLTDQVAEAPVPDTEGQPVPDIESQSVPDASRVDLDSDESVGSEQSEAMRNYIEKVKLDATNRERQRIQNEMRLEQASVDKAQEYHEMLIERLRSGEDPEVIKRELPQYVIANRDWAMQDVLKEFAQQAYALAPEENKKSLQEAIDGSSSASAVANTAKAVLQAAMDKHGLDVIANLDIDILKEHPRLKGWLAEQVKQHMDEEMAAQMTQGKIRSKAPSVTSGAAPTKGITAEAFVSMDKAQQDKYLTNLTAEQEDALLTALYESVKT